MMPSHPAAWIALALAAAIGLYALVLAALYAGQRQILFRPDRTRPDAAPLAELGLVEIRVPTPDGLDLLAWWLPPAPAANGLVVLYLHGNAGHIGHRGARVRAVAARGWGGLFVGYRGYGGNPGQVSEAGLRIDVEAALAALRARGIPPARIVVWGESLGSGLATGLAARHELGAVVLETPYTSIAAIARQRYPFAPVDLLLKDHFDSLGAMPAIRSPVLVAVAGRDRVVPPTMGHALYAASSGSAELWEAPLASHVDMLQFGLLDRIADFLARRLPPR